VTSSRLLIIRGRGRRPTSHRLSFSLGRSKVGELKSRVHYSSNFGERSKANHVYLTANLDAATWGAELAVGEGPGRIYRVEPTGPYEDDPNLTDTRFLGNPTRPYRTRLPLRVVGEVLDWRRHSPRCSRTFGTTLLEGRQLAIDRQGMTCL